MSKLKILLVNEFSQLATGFSVMGDLLLRELHKEYEVAELACYINPHDPRIEDMPWKVYPAQPTPDNAAAWQRHNNNPTAQFGSDVFNDVLMNFQPDVVISWRDCWMDTFIQQTPFRNRFKWIYMPTVDGEPQRLDWLFLYKQADYINTYTRWAKHLLEREGIKVFAAATPGPDVDTFCPPEDKRAHKEKMGLNPDWYIIGSVMRNQPRKLFPDILRAFSLYLKEVEEDGTEEEKQKAANTYLHFHTSLTDVGWDIASEIQRYNLSHKTLLTYVDERTGEAYLSFYKGINAWSMLSPNQKCARTPNTSGNLNRKQLADIVKCYDLYIQYSCCVNGETQVLTKDGYVPISNIKMGDLVLDHQGSWQNVDGVGQFSYGGEKKSISVYGHVDPLIITPDHIVYRLKLDGMSYSTREKVGNLIRAGHFNPEIECVPARDLVEGDMLVSQVHHNTDPLSAVDLSQYVDTEEVNVTESTITRKHHAALSVNRFLTLTDDMLRFIGVFAGDGSATSDGMISITTSDTESENQTLAMNCMSNIGLRPHIYNYKNRNAVGINGCSKSIREIFTKWFKSGINKQLPDWIYQLNPQQCLQVISGLILADGCQRKDRTQNHIYNTTSPTLMQQTKWLLHQCGIQYGLTKRVRGGNRKDMFRFEIARDYTDNHRSNSRNVYFENYYFQQIRSIETIVDNKDVYCITVANTHTFHSEFGITQNCEGLGIPLLEANSCGVPAMGLGYSATAELVEEPHNVDLPIAGWKQELPTETSQLRAVGDVPGLTRHLHIEINRGFDAERSAAARQCVLDKYNHRTFTDGFRGILVQIDASGFRAVWKDQPYIYQPKITEVPNFILNEDFIIWCNQNILGRPYLLTKDTLDSQSKMLETGRRIMDNGVPKMAPFTREMMMNELIEVNNRINEMEVIRYHACNKIPLPQRQKFQVL